MEKIGTTINEQGVLIDVLICEKCGERTVGSYCRNCYLKENWDTARAE